MGSFLDMFHSYCQVQSTHVNQNHPMSAISPSSKNTMSHLFLAIACRYKNELPVISNTQHPTLSILPPGSLLDNVAFIVAELFIKEMDFKHRSPFSRDDHNSNT